ncbi:hypothetical protein LZG74_16980 [Dyadobacter sp. CY327]|uniref:hypothetical protein n=1 Tax=Dyadobacter sp. CY327 TaxID=2907301 RepID=UPI001F1D6907|nr:hypothetical protein [Dyadobacter sp. CY327]MCE7072013.1 hypothetical protein [Dyadobacter sp. CY327]
MEDLRTLHVIKREARDMEIYNEFSRLSQQPGAMKSRVAHMINIKYDLQSNATLHNIRKRVERRLLNQLSNERP